MSTGIKLTATAKEITKSVSGLTTGITLASKAVSRSFAAGGLTTAIRLVGTSKVYEKTNGVLTGNSNGLSFTGPIGGKSTSVSGLFTASLAFSIAGTLTVFPTDNGAGGTFTPPSFALSSGTLSATYAYQPPSGVQQNITLGLTNSGAVVNPAGKNYAALNVSGGVLSQRDMFH